MNVAAACISLHSCSMPICHMQAKCFQLCQVNVQFCNQIDDFLFSQNNKGNALAMERKTPALANTVNTALISNGYP